MKQCPYCGTQNEDDSLFCVECGKPIPQGSVPPNDGESQNIEKAYSPNREQHKQPQQEQQQSQTRVALIIVEYLFYTLAAADFLLGRLNIVDITGVWWSPILFGAIGSLIGQFVRQRYGKADNNDANSQDLKATHNIVAPLAVCSYSMVCPHCGGTMNDGDVFCQNCGRRTNVNSQDFTPATPVAPRDHVPYRPVNYAKPGRSTNWNIIITILLCLILLTGLGIGGYFVYTNYAKKKVEATKEMEKNEPVISGDKKLYGAVDQYPITMSLNIRGSKVKGTYYYNKQGPDRVLTLSGTLKKDELDLIEYNEKGQQTGHFRGHYSKGVIEGVFTTMQGKRLSFRLTE